MSTKIILRFRDLITEDGGTIDDHQTLISKFGEVWWGWWMKQDETPPIELFKNMANDIEKDNFVISYLFDSGVLKLYEINIIKILVAPQKNKIGTPNPEISPLYYHRGRYPAWFLLNHIQEVDFDDLNLTYKSFPTRPEIYKFEDQIGNKVASLENLKTFDVTLWNII